MAPILLAVNVRATTVPDSLANAARPAGRLTVASGGPRSVFAECQQTFLRSAVFPAAIPRLCCRAAVDRPRAPFLVTMYLYYLLIRRRRRTARWQFYFLPRLASLSNSGRTSRRPSGLRKTIADGNSLAHRTTWLRSDLLRWIGPVRHFWSRCTFTTC